MGRIEKIVVLGVVFLIVVILVVSTQGDSGVGGSGVGARPGTVLAQEPGAAPTAAPAQPPSAGTGRAELAGGPERSEVDPLVPGGSHAPARTTPPASNGVPLEAPAGAGARPGRSGDAGVELAAGRPLAPSGAIPAGWDLVTLDGLDEHLFDPELKVYTARRGETLEELARRYYGDPRFRAALERNNEGVTVLEDGRQILLPVRAPAAPAAPATLAPGGSSATPGQVYVVQQGENLWKIAKKVYGAGHRWGEIFDANRDVLSDSNTVVAGLSLRIP